MKAMPRLLPMTQHGSKLEAVADLEFWKGGQGFRGALYAEGSEYEMG